MILLAGCLDPENQEEYYLREVSHDELLDYVTIMYDSNTTRFDLTIIDLSDNATYQQGHIPHAVNIELPLLVDTAGYIVNNARTLTANYDRNQVLLFYSSTNDTVEYTVAKMAQLLDYRKVLYYDGGKQEWQDEYGDCLWIDYPVFEEYQESVFEGNDSTVYLVDVHPRSWYLGEETLNGHIPGAINIPLEQVVDKQAATFSLRDSGRVIPEHIPHKSSTIILYDSNSSSNLAIDFALALKMLGYKNSFLLRRGYELWIEKGNALETDE